MGRVFGSVFGALIFVVLLFVAFGSWYTIDQGERGVLLRNGAFVRVADPGLGFKTPWIEDVYKISIQQQVAEYQKIATYSRDQQTALLGISVSYSVDPADVDKLYVRYGDLENARSRLIDRQVNQQAEIVMGRYNAITAVQDRAKLSADLQMAIRDAVPAPLIIQSVQLENIDFSDAYEASIEQRMQAEVEVQKLQQNAEREKVQAQITVTQAQARADSVLAQARADADATKLRADADAYAVREKKIANAAGIEAENSARIAALDRNPAIVDYLRVTAWDGKLPTTMVPDGSVPFVNVQH